MEAVLPAPLCEAAPAYEEDAVLWMEHQISLLRAGRCETLDLPRLIEELEGIVRRERRELSSRLKIIMLHLLKCEYQSSRKCRSWLSSLREQREEIALLLDDSPSLRAEVAAHARKRYRQAVRAARDETRLPLRTFPAELPYTAEQLLDDEFVP
jgi:hypothetical protein